MIIQHNLTTLNASRRLTTNDRKTANAIEKLSSGLRINKAADDAAGLAISEKMRAQIRGLTQAERNVQDGISLIQTAEAGLSAILDPPLQRMRELTIQAANGTLTDKDRTIIQQEIEQIKKGIDSIANGTEFNGIKLLNQPEMIPVESTVVNVNTSTNNTTTTQMLPPYINWSTNSINGQMLDVCYDSSRYVAVGRDGDIAYSDDGTHWTNVTGIPANIMIDVEHGNGTFVAVGHGGFMHSTDGVNWSWSINTNPPLDINDYSSYSVAFDGTKFVATAINHNDWSTYKVLTSTDGVNWNVQDSPENLDRICWGNGQFIAIGKNNIYTSLDGDSWTFTKSFTSLGYTDFQNYLSYTGGKYFIGGKGSGHMLVSGDGINWINTEVTNIPGMYLYGVASDGNQYIVIGDSFSGADRIKYYHSPDGINWLYDDTPNGNPICSMTWDGSKFISVGFYRVDIGIPVDPTTVPEPPITTETTTTSNETSNTVGNVSTITRTDVVNNTQRSESHFHTGIALTENSTVITTTTTTVVTKDNIKNKECYKNIQTGANEGNSLEITLCDARTSTLGVNEIEVTSLDKAQSAITKIDAAIKSVSSQRSKMGAYQNALEHIMNNVTNVAENITSAESHIRDVDMAKEMMEFTKNSILVQASQAILAQANQLSQSILQLLR